MAWNNYALNVWGIIWPNQKKVLGIKDATDEEKNVAKRKAFLASRTNTLLSIPMIFFMGASLIQIYTFFDLLIGAQI